MQVRFLLARFLIKTNHLDLNKYIMSSYKQKSINKLKIDALRVRHSFFFISITSPFIINNLKLNYLSLNEKKVFVKQSYILLTWFYYLSALQQPTTKKKLKIATLPSIKKIFTLVKSPMAHKNWSKEQYKFQYFKFKITFNSSFNNNLSNKINHINSINAAILFSLITKKNIFSLETNVFFLKFMTVRYTFNDFIFFNYYDFIKNK